MTKTVEAIIDPEGTIHFRDKIRLTRPQRVLITLLEEESTTPDGEDGSVAQMLALLAEPLFRDRPFGSAAELEATVEHNRHAWDE